MCAVGVDRGGAVDLNRADIQSRPISANLDRTVGAIQEALAVIVEPAGRR